MRRINGGNTLTNEELHLQVSLSHSYLEVARAVLLPSKAVEHDRAKQLDYPTLFSLLSVTILYSYLSLESFINYHFGDIHKQSILAHDSIEELKKSKPNEDLVPEFSSFYENYGKIPVEKLRLELKKKITELCNALGYSQLHDVNPKLWQDFCDVLKPARDFLVHPVPDPDIFQERMSRMMSDTPSGNYVEITTGIIEHFYEQAEKTKPSWLYKNEFLQFEATRPI